MKNDKEQLSLFDIELPPYNEPETEVRIVEAKPKETASFAKVPDEEFIYTLSKTNVPTVGQILKLLEKGLYKVNAHEFLSDVFECGAIAISNRFDFRQYQKREERYLQIIKKIRQRHSKPACGHIRTHLFVADTTDKSFCRFQ